MLNNEIVSEQILAINRNNSNQLSEKVNRIECKLLPNIKRAVMQIKEKVHIAGSRLYLYKTWLYQSLTKSEFRDEARPDIRARMVWRQGQNAFLDIRLTNVNTNSNKK